MKNNLFNKLITLLVVLSISGQSVAFAQNPEQQEDKLRIGYNDATGKVSFIGADPSRPISIRSAQTQGLKADSRALAMISAYATDFGLKNPSSELKLIEADQVDGREMTRFQQVYKGIPIMGGEMIVNATDAAELLSLSGEISPDLSVQTTPTISLKQAQLTALSMMAKSNQTSMDAFEATTPELWIYDSRLLESDGTKPALVWRMNVKSKDDALPLNELVLVDAQRGNILLNFNQIDTVWKTSEGDDDFSQPAQILQAANWPIYFEIALDESRGWIYGSDSAGNKIDVISTDTLQLVKSIPLANGANPKGIALSPDGTELAVAQNGLGSLLFIDPDTTGPIATIIPAVAIGANPPWDVIYGRAGRLYSTGNPGSTGTDHIHVIDTVTHTEVSKSTDVVRSAPRLSISSDKNSLYVSFWLDPTHLAKYDISTDTIPSAANRSPVTSDFRFTTFIVDPVNNYVFIDTGQIWSSNLKAKLGSTGVAGQVTYIPTRDAIAVAASGMNSVVVIDSNNFQTLSTYPLQGPMGALVAQSDGNKVFVDTIHGIVAIDLTSFPPGIPGTPPAGSLPYSDIVLDETRQVLYGSNTTGHKIDVISMSTLQVVDEIRLMNGASPTGMDLSPDGSELTVALSESSQLAFINTNTRVISATIVLESDVGYDVIPWDVKYGRTGRLYSTGLGLLDYIRVIDTATHTIVARAPSYGMGDHNLAISADKNYLLALKQSSGLYKHDITTDTIPLPYPTQYIDLAADSYILLQDESRVFASNNWANSGQVWSNPSNLASSVLLGTFAASGDLIEIPRLGVVAALGKSGEIKFIKTSDYSISNTFILPNTSKFGPSALNAAQDKLFINADGGIAILNLDLSHPSYISGQSGSDQSAQLGTQFPLPIRVKVENYLHVPIAGLTVTFTAPSYAASGVFSDTNTNTTSAVTDGNGVATSSNFIANNQRGAYKVYAAVYGLNDSVGFSLLNSFIINAFTYTLNHTVTMPGTFLCDQAMPACTNGYDSDADAAHRYAMGTSTFYAINHGRNSLDNLGMTIISSVHYSYDYRNAFWNGWQMIYGDNYPSADDVVAHELTHGVTQYESNLFYYYQSGAINESFSDIWGELYDQQNGLGNDSGAAKWKIGENLPGGAVRSMSDPRSFGDPSILGDYLYKRDSSDNGGVHSNSGVNNKAAYLMVDGGAFNGKTITALGAHKTLAVYYEVQTHLLTSGADYADLYNALYQGCLNLIGGSDGITSNNCTQVRNATDAVQMNGQYSFDVKLDAPLCSAGQSPNNIFFDGFETGGSTWAFDGKGRWQLDSPYGDFAHSGTQFLYANDYPAVVTDTNIRMTSPVLIPSNGYLRFAHAYDFETYTGDPNFYDGGVVEYSKDSGASWIDASPLFNSNGYTGGITALYDNPLKGRSAFVGTSHGYTSTRLDLSSLSGQSVIFRWRMGLDTTGFRWGWWLDDVQIYNCAPSVSSITRSNPTPTASASVKFTVTFSGPVAGVNLIAPFNDFSLTTSPGISGASITSVNGSGAIYSVTVNTGSGNGTIRLNVLDDNSIVDSSTIPLGGIVVGDGTFTSGDSYKIIKSSTGGSATGVFRPSNGVLFMKNANTSGFADIAINYGVPADYPVTGDWDGNGTATIGVYRNGQFLLRNSNTLGFADLAFAFGQPGDQPIAGDWDGDGIDTIGIFRPSTGQFLLRNSNSAGAADASFFLGNVGDVGIAGDWNGDGMDTTGVFRPSNGVLFMKNANTSGFADIAINYGIPGDRPVTGDWDNDGIDTIGVYRNGQFLLRNSNTLGFADLAFYLGNPGDMPIAGNWDGIP